MITTVLCYSATSGSSVADCGKPCRVDMGNVGLLCPPVPEQTAIVEHLDKATAGIDAAISRARRQTELLREYRTRLIADVVTGKLDVRETTANLPEEARQ